eukprot:RCo055071
MDRWGSSGPVRWLLLTGLGLGCFVVGRSWGLAEATFHQQQQQQQQELEQRQQRQKSASSTPKDQGPAKPPPTSVSRQPSNICKPQRSATATTLLPEATQSSPNSSTPSSPSHPRSPPIT